MHESCPVDNRVPKNYSKWKNKVRSLRLDLQTIDYCRSGCMLYFKEDLALENCKFRDLPRWKPNKSGDNRFKPKSYVTMFYFPLTPRLQRLYASRNIAEQMRWHYNNRREDGVLRHPLDGEAWKHFDRKHSDFAYEPGNVRLGSCANRFSPFSQSKRPYSIWHVAVTPYNLPPDMCMKTPYMFLTCITPGPTNLNNKIDVCLQPLIDELRSLWDGVQTYDILMR